MAQSQEGKRSTVTVTGEGVVKVVPDMATVRFGIVSRHNEPEEARRINANTSREAMNAIRELGIEETKLSLQTLRLQPVREYDPQTRKQIDKGFEASRDLVVEVEDLDILPSVVALIVQKGANRLSGITYGLQEQDLIRDQALIEAVERARDKATLMANTLDVNIGMVVQIIEQSFSMPIPIVQMETTPRVMMAKSDAAPEPESYAAGEMEVRAVVQVVFELE